MRVIDDAPISIAQVRGPEVFQEVEIPDDARGVKMMLKRNTSDTRALWSDSRTAVRAICELSIDGGQTWRELMWFEATGGERQIKGRALDYSSWSWEPLPEGKQRRARVLVEMKAQPPLTTALVLETF